MLHKNAVEEATLALIRRLMADEQLSAFNLIGGTALALKIGHRASIDIDLFTSAAFIAADIANHLSLKYNAQRVTVLKNAVFCFIEEIKIDLIAHQYPLIKPVELTGDIRMLSLADIGAMKLHAIVNNGTRLKDFVDFYFLLEKMPFQEMLLAYEEKYAETNTVMAKTALLYHNDIDFSVPILLLDQKIEWDLIKTRLEKAVKYPQRVFPSAGPMAEGLTS